jgi:hypothetical protein
MFNVNLYTILFIIYNNIFFQNNLQNKSLLILDFLQIMSSWKFEEIIAFKDFEVENGVLKLERDIYLNIVKILDLSILRKSMSKYF